MDFSLAEEKFKQLKTKFEAGTLSESDFNAQLEKMMVQDDQGDWWMIGYETEQWYRHDGKDWVKSDPQGSQLNKIKPKATTTPKIDTSALQDIPEAQRALWKFEIRELILSVIGLGVFTLLYYLSREVYINTRLPFLNIWPAYAVPLFFGLAFGPVVGIIVGAMSYIISNLVIGNSFYNLYSQQLFFFAFFGLIMGMAKVSINKFRTRNGILRAEFFVIISILVPTILFRNWFPSQYTVYSEILRNIFLRETLPLLGWSLIIIPISMIAYSFIMSWIKTIRK